MQPIIRIQKHASKFLKTCLEEKTHRSVLEVDLVADDNKGEVLRIAWTRLNEKLVTPAVEGLECVRHGHVKDEYTAVGASVEGDAQALEPLLAGSVPDLKRGSS